MHKDKPPHPGVFFPPPLIFVLGFAVGLLIHRTYPFYIMTEGRTVYAWGIGWCGVGIGLTWMLWGMITFFRARTAILPNRPASELVIRGTVPGSAVIPCM